MVIGVARGRACWLNSAIEVRDFNYFFCSKAIYNRCKQQVPPVALQAQKNEVFRGLRKYHVSPWDDWVGVSVRVTKQGLG